MSTLSPSWHKERRQRHWLMAATAIDWSSFLHSTNSLCFSSARRHYNKTSQVRVLHRLRWKCKFSCVLSRLRNKLSSRFYKNFIILNKIVLKILWLCLSADIHSIYELTNWQPMKGLQCSSNVMDIHSIYELTNWQPMKRLQCSSNVIRPVTRRAAAFSTYCNRLSCCSATPYNSELQ